MNQQEPNAVFFWLMAAYLKGYRAGLQRSEQILTANLPPDLCERWRVGVGLQKPVE
jgi:hypothetical protein